MSHPVAPPDNDPAADPLTPSRVTEIVREAAQRLGLDITGATRTKFTNNAVMILPEAGAVLRIAGSEVMRSRVPAVIRAAQWYAEHDIPAVRLWPDLPQPVEVESHLLTVWQRVIPGGPDPTPADLGAILRAIHSAVGPTPDLPEWRVVDGLRRRVVGAETIDDETRDYLTAELDAVRATLSHLKDLPPLIPPGVLHGDAHLGNLIPSPSGPIICDFDATSIGPREWDLTPAAVGSLRFRYPVDVHRGLVHAYGVDVTTWPGFPALRRLRELQLVTSVIPSLNINPALRPQWQHRLDTFRAANGQEFWTPYAEAGA